jgi:hypothetical protein
MLSESRGREILKDVFESRGLRIAEDFPFKEEGVTVNLDGWDPGARVGYEYMTHTDRDHEDLDPDEMLRISEWNEAGKLFLFIIDETDIDDEEELRQAASRFLDEVDKRSRGDD